MEGNVTGPPAVAGRSLRCQLRKLTEIRLKATVQGGIKFTRLGLGGTRSRGNVRKDARFAVLSGGTRVHISRPELPKKKKGRVPLAIKRSQFCQRRERGSCAGQEGQRAHLGAVKCHCEGYS